MPPAVPGQSTGTPGAHRDLQDLHTCTCRCPQGAPAVLEGAGGSALSPWTRSLAAVAKGELIKAIRILNSNTESGSSALKRQSTDRLRSLFRDLVWLRRLSEAPGLPRRGGCPRHPTAPPEPAWGHRAGSAKRDSPAHTASSALCPQGHRGAPELPKSARCPLLPFLKIVYFL